MRQRRRWVPCPVPCRQVSAASSSRSTLSLVFLVLFVHPYSPSLLPLTSLARFTFRPVLGADHHLTVSCKELAAALRIHCVLTTSQLIFLRQHFPGMPALCSPSLGCRNTAKSRKSQANKSRRKTRHEIVVWWHSLEHFFNCFSCCCLPSSPPWRAHAAVGLAAAGPEEKKKKN